MNLITKVLIVFVLTAAAFCGGLYMGRGQVVEKVVEKKGEERVVYRDRTVTVTRTVKPDGTVQETTKTEDKSGTKTTKNTDKKKDTTPILAQWRAGIGYQIQYESPLDRDAAQVSVQGGRRILGPIWLDMQVNKSNATLGVALEF